MSGGVTEWGRRSGKGGRSRKREGICVKGQIEDVKEEAQGLEKGRKWGDGDKGEVKEEGEVCMEWGEEYFGKGTIKEREDRCM